METAAIAEVLGGRKVLGKIIRKPDDLARLVREGLPASMVTALAQRLRIGNSVLSGKLGIPQRTLTRRLSQRSLLTPAESDRTVRVARVYANAVEMIGDPEKAIECSALRIERSVAKSRLISSTPMSGLRWSMTSWAASPIACTANALLANLPTAIRC
jgi:putative toxin-antitoxin system antitoxin component (TIGR02293 family)